MISKRIDRKQKTSDFDRLGRYVLEAKNDAAAILWTRTAEYVMDVKADSDGHKVLWYRISNCEADIPAMAIVEVLATQAENTRSTIDKTYHCVVSFQEGEHPTKAQIEDIENCLCEALGFGDHQRISSVHQDTDNIHLHLAINKVHPKTFNVLEPYRDYYIRDQICREMELKHGLNVDNGIGQGKRYGKEQTMEAHSVQQTFWRWIQDNAKEGLLTSLHQLENWQTLHTKMAEYGLVIKPRGAGFVIGSQDGNAHIKASSIDKNLSFKRLTERFGDYEAPTQTIPSQKPEQHYQATLKIKDEASQQLYVQFQTEKQMALQKRSEFKTQQQEEKAEFLKTLKEWHSEERNRIKTSAIPGHAKRNAYSQISIERQRLFDAHRKKEDEQRKSLFEAYPLQTWEQFLVKNAEIGNSKALELLRYRKQKQAKIAKALLTADNYESAKHIVYEHLRPIAKKNGDLIYRVQDGGSVTDERTRVRVDTLTAGSAFLALTMASERFDGQPLDVQGEDEFKQQVAQFAAQYGMAVKFKDEQLERQRLLFQNQLHSKTLSPALEAFITQRNNLKDKVSDILPHRIWTEADNQDTLTYRGRRNLTDGTQAVLLQRGSEMLVKPVQANEFQDLKVGQTLPINQKSKGQVYER